MNEGVQAMILCEMGVVSMIRFFYSLFFYCSSSKNTTNTIYRNTILNFHAYFPPLVCCFLAKNKRLGDSLGYITLCVCICVFVCLYMYVISCQVAIFLINAGVSLIRRMDVMIWQLTLTFTHLQYTKCLEL